MAQLAVRLNVTASQFPFISDQEGATVVVANQDTYYVRPNQFTEKTTDKNIDIPQFLFIENCIPTSYGMSAVGFDNNTQPFPGGLDQADQVIYLRGRTGRRYIMNFNRQKGKVFIYSPEISAWQEIFTVLQPLSQAYVALVKGRCFFYFKNHPFLFEFGGFNTITNVFDYVVMPGVGGIADLSPMFGLVATNNYLIFFSRTLIYYTIPEDTYGSVPDFTPSLGPTGAASESPSVLKGIILTCLPTQDGFYIFTSTNIVAAFYSGNIRFPWTYRELEGSAAINSLDTIASDQDGYPKYAYTTAGLLKIGKSQCTPVFVEASEFIGNNTYEYFDWPTKEIIRRVTAAPLNVGMAYVSNRWLVISYGSIGEIFTHAILWDEHLKRWGKIQLNHARVLQYYGIPATIVSVPGYTYQDLLDLGWTYQDLLDMGLTYADLGGIDYAGNPDIALEYKSLGFMSSTGVVQIVNFDISRVTDVSVAILGRFQLTRNRRFDIISLWLENMNQNTATELTKAAILSTDDGKNVARKEYGWLAEDNGGSMMKFQYSNSEGLNHFLRFEGDFDLSTIVVVGSQTGRGFD